jgi:hypothetical protein
MSSTYDNEVGQGYCIVGFSRNVLAAIANKLGEAGDSCEIEFVKSFGVSD